MGGSFLGVVTWRLPKKESYIGGRSKCPSCRREIYWYDNIPLLSFVFLGGKCRFCKKTISWRYPLIEAVTACLFVVFGQVLKTCQIETVCNWKNALGFFSFPFLMAIILLTVAILVIDLEKGIIPDELIFFGFILTLLALVFGKQTNFYAHLFAGFLSALVLLCIHLITKGKGMGLGDVKYAIFGGTLLGYPASIIWLFLAFLTGGAASIILILTGRKDIKSRIAFGPFLAMSFLLTLLTGGKLLEWFLGI